MSPTTLSALTRRERVAAGVFVAAFAVLLAYVMSLSGRPHLDVIADGTYPVAFVAVDGSKGCLVVEERSVCGLVDREYGSLPPDGTVDAYVVRGVFEGQVLQVIHLKTPPQRSGV